MAEIENKIGSGLIEELIQVAEGELKLVDVMVQSKAYVLLSLYIFLWLPARIVIANIYVFLDGRTLRKLR